MGEFESHWALHWYGFVPQLSKKLSKLQLVGATFIVSWRIADLHKKTIVQVQDKIA